MLEFAYSSSYTVLEDLYCHMDNFDDMFNNVDLVYKFH